jgi:hypothetical protein
MTLGPRDSLSDKAQLCVTECEAAHPTDPAPAGPRAVSGLDEFPAHHTAAAAWTPLSHRERGREKRAPLALTCSGKFGPG